MFLGHTHECKLICLEKLQILSANQKKGMFHMSWKWPHHKKSLSIRHQEVNEKIRLILKYTMEVGAYIFSPKSFTFEVKQSKENW